MNWYRKHCLHVESYTNTRVIQCVLSFFRKYIFKPKFTKYRTNFKSILHFLKYIFWMSRKALYSKISLTLYNKTWINSRHEIIMNERMEKSGINESQSQFIYGWHFRSRFFGLIKEMCQVKTSIFDKDIKYS